MFRLLEEAGFTRVRSAVVPRFRFRKESTQNSAEAYGVKAVMMTALKPGGDEKRVRPGASYSRSVRRGSSTSPSTLACVNSSSGRARRAHLLSPYCGSGQTPGWPVSCSICVTTASSSRTSLG